MDNKVYYTTWGHVRGDCGHMHRGVGAALVCMEHDSVVCRRQGGYSDREVRIIESRKDLDTYDVRRGPGRDLLFEGEAEW